MTYPTTARTLLGNIEHNLRGIRARVGDRLVLAAVKANAYGHGAAAVSQMIERTGAADWLGVATVEEGLQLRDAGVSLPILKFSPTRDVDDVTRALLAGITLSVVDEASIAQVAAAADALDLSDVAVHLKVDTGMRRIGVAPDQAAALALVLERECPDVDLQGLFTHLPVADTAAEDAFTRDQLARFAAVVDDVQAAIGRRIELVHAANSGGVLAHEQSWFDLVRPGIMIYGSYPDPATVPTRPLRDVGRWTSRVTFLKRIRAGEISFRDKGRKRLAVVHSQGGTITRADIQHPTETAGLDNRTGQPGNIVLPIGRTGAL